MLAVADTIVVSASTTLALALGVATAARTATTTIATTASSTAAATTTAAIAATSITCEYNSMRCGGLTRVASLVPTLELHRVRTCLCVCARGVR